MKNFAVMVIRWFPLKIVSDNIAALYPR